MRECPAGGGSRAPEAERLGQRHRAACRWPCSDGPACDDFWQRAGDGVGNGRVIQAQPVGQPCDLAGDVGGGHGGDDGRGGAQRADLALGMVEPAGPALEFGVDNQVGKRVGAVGQDSGESLGGVVGQDLGRILPSRQDYGRDFRGELAEQVVGADGGAAARRVGVERDQDAGRRAGRRRG